MELRQLQYFASIARHRGFRRAADELGVSQAALSQQVKLLEADLGVRLFERDQRPIELTQAGRALLERAELILRSVASAREEMGEFAGLHRGFVSVGTLRGAAWTPRLLGAFRRAYPGLEIALAEHTSDALLTLLGDGQLDVACLNQPARGDAGGALAARGIAFHPITSFDIVFAVGPGHRFARRGRVPLAELAEQPLVVPPQSSFARTLDRVFGERGLVPRIRFSVGDEAMLLGLAAENLAVGVATRGRVAAHPDLRLSVVEAADADLRGTSGVAWTERALRTRAVAALVDFARGWRPDA